MSYNNKRAVENFIVTLPAQTTLAAAGALNNTSTSGINVNNGQLAIVAVSDFGTVAPWNITDATPTLAEAPVIALVQGTPYSANPTQANVPYPLWPRTMEITHPIDGRRKDIRVTKQAFTLATHDIWQIGAPNAATSGNVPVTNDVEYQIAVRLKGRRQQEQFSREQNAYVRATFPATNFTALGLNTANSRDYIMTNLAVNINSNSEIFTQNFPKKGSDPVVALLMGEATATGATEVATLAVGQVVPVFISGGVTKSITITAELLSSIQTAAAAAPLLTHILTADLADAGLTTKGTASAIWLVATDERVAFSDYMTSVKVYLQPGVTGGFASTTLVSQLSKGKEGQGYGRQLRLLYQATQGQRKYFGQHTQVPIIEFDNPIVESEKYTVYNILYNEDRQIDVANVSVSPHRAIVCIPAESAPTVTNVLLASFESALNNWLSSTGNAAITA